MLKILHTRNFRDNNECSLRMDFANQFWLNCEVNTSIESDCCIPHFLVYVSSESEMSCTELHNQSPSGCTRAKMSRKTSHDQPFDKGGSNSHTVHAKSGLSTVRAVPPTTRGLQHLTVDPNPKQT